MKGKYQEENPSNARVFINYKDKKNPVTFEYPNKQTVFKATYWTIISLWTYLNLIFIIFNVLLIGGYGLYHSDRSDSSNFNWDEFKEYLLGKLILIIVLGIYLFGTPLIITLIITKNKKLLARVPILGILSNTLHNPSYSYKKIGRLDSKVFEIPIFGNLFLDYKATKDFSKYLVKVEVTEHDFEVVKIGSITKRKKVEQQDEYWKARFIFSKIPKTGYLEIKFQ